MSLRRSAIALVIASVLLLLCSCVSGDDPPEPETGPVARPSLAPPVTPPATVTPAAVALPRSPGGRTVIPSWRMQSATAAPQGGETLSAPDFDDRGWYLVGARSTVLAGLVANGRYPDLNRSTNLRDAVDPAEFQVPWWYRATFTAAPRSGTKAFLRLDGGVIARGELWVNGHRVAGPDQIAGAYPAHTFDVTRLLRAGRNAIAIKAMPAATDRDLIVHFVDWAPSPPGAGQGLFRDVALLTTGPVRLSGARVRTDLELPGMTRAALTVRAEAHNTTGRPVTAEITAKVAGLTARTRVRLAARETATVTLADLVVDKPKVWWPWQLGDQPLYRLDLRAESGGRLSDTAQVEFGIRHVRSTVDDHGARRFEINGVPLLIRGAGWSSDLLLRTDPQRLADELTYARDLGLNTLRLEGKLEGDELYRLADRLGLLLLPGWECCSKWERYDTFTAEDRRIAQESMRSEALRIGSHPSVIGFLIGSDKAPPADLEQAYLEALHAADWDLPVIAAAGGLSGAATGPSGMKMLGPYWWVPPVYWYADLPGSAHGFSSETGPGPSIPELESLRGFLSPAELDALWRDYQRPQYHLSPSEYFSRLGVWGTALDARYGKPKSLADFVRKAQAMGYEINRAQFEAFGRNWSRAERPATGVVYWLLNSGWPTLFWNLYGHDLVPAGGYYGAQAALRPLHAQYSYDDGSVVLVNTGRRAAAGLSLRITAFDLDGGVRLDETREGLGVDGSAATEVFRLSEDPDGVSGAYFLRLVLRDGAGRQVDRNVYWLSTRRDTLDVRNAQWHYTPQDEYADLTGLQDLPRTKVTVTAASTARGDGRITTEVTIANDTAGGPVAFLARAVIRKGAGGAALPAVRWSENYVTLWPGESVTLTAEYRRADLGRAVPHVEVSGWNVATVRVPAEPDS